MLGSMVLSSPLMDKAVIIFSVNKLHEKTKTNSALVVSQKSVAAPNPLASTGEINFLKQLYNKNK